MKKHAELLKINVWPFKWMEYIALLIVFITPLYVNINFWYPFGSPKILVASAGIFLMTILYSWGVLISKRFSLRLTLLHLAFLFFLFIITLSSILGVDPHNSFFGVFSFPTNLIYIYLVSIFAVFIGFLSRQNKQFIRNILLTSFLSSLPVAFFAYSGTSIFSRFTDYSSTIGNSSYTGGYLLFNIFFGLGLFLYYKNYWHKALLAFGTLAILFSPLFFNINIFFGKIGISEIIQSPLLLLGVANGAVLGIIVGVIAVIIFSLIFSSKHFVKIIGFWLLFIFLSGLIYTSHKFVDPTSSIHRVYVEEKGENRFLAWEMARKSLMDRPILGSGFNNFYYNFQKYLTHNIYDTNVEFLLQPHNVIWEYASNTGLLGLLAYLGLLLMTMGAFFGRALNKIVPIERSDKIFSLILIGALFGYFVQNLFVFDTMTTYLMLFLVIGLGFGISVKGWQIELPSSKLIVKIVSVLVILLSLGLIVLFVIMPWREAIKWRKAATTTNLRLLSPLRAHLQETSLFGGVDDSAYLATKLFNFYINNISKVDDSNRHLFIEEIDSLIAQVERDQLSQPPNFRATLIIGKLLSLRMFIVGKLDQETWDKANDYLDRTLLITDQSPEVHLAKAQLYIFKKNYVRARESVVQALTLVPKYKDSYKIAERIQTLSPDKTFGEYIAKMEANYLPKP